MPQGCKEPSQGCKEPLLEGIILHTFSFFFFLEEYILLPVSLLFQISRVENPGCHTTSCDDDTTRMPRSTPGTPVKSDSETTPVDPCFSHHQPHCRYSPALCKGSSENNLQRHSGAVFLCIFQHFII